MCCLGENVQSLSFIVRFFFHVVVLTALCMQTAASQQAENCCWYKIFYFNYRVSYRREEMIKLFESPSRNWDIVAPIVTKHSTFEKEKKRIWKYVLFLLNHNWMTARSTRIVRIKVWTTELTMQLTNVSDYNNSSGSHSWEVWVWESKRWFSPTPSLIIGCKFTVMSKVEYS